MIPLIVRDGERPLAVLTGASSGIGAALAPVLARHGYDLILVARREALLGEVAERARAARSGARVELACLDVTDPGAASRLVELAPAARLLVNNAGFGIFGRAIEVDEGEHRRMIALNVTALMDLTLAFARRMAAQPDGGVVLNMASLAAFTPIPYQSVYAATKAFVVSFSEGLHYELRGRNVSVIAYSPGPTLTENNEVEGSGQHLAQGRRAYFLTAAQVAEDAARAIEHRRENGIPGWLNRLFALLLAVVPRRFARWVVGRIYGSALRDV